MFFDLERVEINRGPQGTLRGRNATAGSLNLVTAKPKLNEQSAESFLSAASGAVKCIKLLRTDARLLLTVAGRWCATNTG